MIPLFFIYIDVAIFRCRLSYIIVNSLFLSRRRNDYYIIRVSFSFRVTPRVILRITLFFCNNNNNNSVYNSKEFVNNNHVLLINYLINHNNYFLILLSQYILKFK